MGERSERNMRSLRETFQNAIDNGDRLWLGALEIRQAVPQLFTAIIELALITSLRRVPQFTNEQAHAFLTYRIAGRDVKQQERQKRNPPQVLPR